MLTTTHTVDQQGFRQHEHAALSAAFDATWIDRLDAPRWVWSHTPPAEPAGVAE